MFRTNKMFIWLEIWRLSVAKTEVVIRLASCLGYHTWPGGHPQHDFSITWYTLLLFCTTSVSGPNATIAMAILVTRLQQLARPHLRHQHGTLHQHRCLESSPGLVLARWLPVRRTCHHIFKTSTTIRPSLMFFWAVIFSRYGRMVAICSKRTATAPTWKRTAGVGARGYLS